MSDGNLDEIFEYLNELKEDNTISKNVREKISNIINVLSEESELSLRVNKVMQNLDEISEDISLPSYTRTQIWNIVTLLENVI
ncbi:hypothetical protein C0585_05405 [Candidatus Woesearchaeota archaeon]|nr:MAG: hypothetical protein C0585_05405 [Candidatus Woesearchaeota archaeon]